MEMRGDLLPDGSFISIICRYAHSLLLLFSPKTLKHAPRSRNKLSSKNKYKITCSFWSL